MLFAVFLAIFSVPVFAVGNLTVTGTNLAASYVNKNASTDFLNLTLTVDPTDVSVVVNITSLNVSINGTVGTENVSAIEIKNSTGHVIAANTTNASATHFQVFFTPPHTVNSSTNSSLIIAVNISNSAVRLTTIAVNITSNASIVTAAADNVTVTNGHTASAVSTIWNMRASASISPRLVDTSVLNQTLVYTITPLGDDSIQNISITIPTGYTLENVSTVSDGGTLLGSHQYSNTTRATQLNISLNSPTTNQIKINFTVNTNASFLNLSGFPSRITGANLSNIATVTPGTQINVTTQTLINVSSVNFIKSSALINGTDYWEFNFTLNFTASISSGFIQFKMENWSDGSGNTIALTNESDVTKSSTARYANLRDSTNSSHNLTVLTYYNDTTTGLTLINCCTAGTLYHVVLKMIIPLGTPVSSSWFTTYSMLYRATE